MILKRYFFSVETHEVKAIGSCFVPFKDNNIPQQGANQVQHSSSGSFETSKKGQETIYLKYVRITAVIVSVTVLFSIVLFTLLIAVHSLHPYHLKSL